MALFFGNKQLTKKAGLSPIKTTTYEEYLEQNSDTLIIPGYIEDIQYGTSDSTYKKIIVPSSVKSMGSGLFESCYQLESVEINCPIERLPNDCFGYCEKLKEVKLVYPTQFSANRCFATTGFETLDWIPTHIKVLPRSCFSNIFMYHIIIPDHIEEIKENCFEYNYQAKCVYIPSSMKTIASNAFSGDTSITRIFVNKPQDSISGAPWGATNATVVWENTPSVLFKTNTNSRSVPTIKLKINNQSQITQDYYIGQVGDVVEYEVSYTNHIGDSGVITLTNGISVVDVNRQPYTLYHSLLSNSASDDISIPYDGDSLSPGIFANCSYITSVNTGEWKNVKTLPSYFFYYSGITKFDAPPLLEHIGDQCFHSCENLTKLDFSKMKKLKSLGESAFYYAKNVSEMDLSMCENLTTIGERCFGEMNSVKEFILPNTIQIIPSGCFRYCLSLETMNIPDSVLTLQPQSFIGCNKLAHVTLPLSLISIQDYAFLNCSSLTSIEIPSSVNRIISSSFSGCSNLATITINKPQDSISGAPWGAPNATVIWNG